MHRKLRGAGRKEGSRMKKLFSHYRNKRVRERVRSPSNSSSPFLIVRGNRVQITGGAGVYQNEDVTGLTADANPTIHVFDVIAVVKSANITVRSTIIAPSSCLHRCGECATKFRLRYTMKLFPFDGIPAYPPPPPPYLSQTQIRDAGGFHWEFM